MSLRSRIRTFLGLDNLPSVDMWKALDLAQRERQKVTLAAIADLSKRLEAAHAFEPVKRAVLVPDWDSVQQLALDSAIEHDKNRKDPE